MRRKDLTTQERNLIVQFLLESIHNGELGKGKIKEAAANFKVHKRTIGRIWAAAKQQQENGQAIHIQSGNLQSSKTKRVQIDLELIASLPLQKRSTIRSLAHGISRSKTTVGRWVKKGEIRAHTSAIRPELTAPNKLMRLRFSLEALEVDTILKTLRFRCMQNTIHIDEKWYNMTRATHRFYLTLDEADPHRTCKSKKFITKVMFMCAVCRPIFGPNGEVLFDGKTGIFPFTEMLPTQRKSKNRPASTLETKAITSVTKDVVRDCLINKILPAIKEKWPAGASKFIYIQQDNAKPHITNSDSIFKEAAQQDGFTFTLVKQPPNSPDTNVNDLGWFRAIDALQAQTNYTTIDELIEAVKCSFEELSPSTLNNVFLSLQGWHIEIMRLRGDNCYKVLHYGKEALIKANALPLNFEVPEELVRQCLIYLFEEGSSVGLIELMDTLGIQMVEDGT